MRLKKFLLMLLTVSLLIISAFSLSLVFSPKPASLIIRKFFEGGMEIEPDNFDEIANRVIVENNLVYESEYKSNQFDLYSPKTFEGNLPVILWVHGGGFVGGDKSDLKAYATQIADKGYHVVSMNYALAPEAQYPIPIYQIAEIYKHLIVRQEEYGLDLDQLFLAGDSAGAHMISQFSLIQTDALYAEKVKIDQSVDSQTIKGVLLFSGPYDLRAFAEKKVNNRFLDFFFTRVAWSYLGQRDWSVIDQYQLLSIVDHVSNKFPSTFITDGTKDSFTQQGETLARALRLKGVQVTDVFYDDDKELKHEYQFQMNQEASVETFKKLIEFLDQRIK